MGTHPIFESDFDCLTDVLSELFRDGFFKQFLIFFSNYPLSTTYTMVKGKSRQVWKADYFEKAQGLLTNYNRLFVVDADNVSSRQFQDIRRGLRGVADILMGKNTMMKKVIRQMLGNNPDLEKLLPHIRKNIGFVLTNGDLKEIRDLVMSYKVQAPARAGAISDVDVIVPPQNTGLGPEKTSFFQALSIPTKISRGSIEITGSVHLLRPGDKVGQSESALLNMLKISPFTYGLDIVQVYDSGSVFSPEVLDITPEDIRARFCGAVSNVAAVSLAIGYPTLASVPHSIANGFKNLMAVAAVTDIEFAQVETLKAYLADPSAFAVAAPVASAAATEAPKEAAAAAESEPDSDDSMGFGLFD